MKKSTVVHSPPEIPEGMCRLDAVRPQPKLGGNGCCCRCCGAAPGDVDPAKILADGGRFVQLGNDGEGRIVEYFVYGSTAPDAGILIQVNGSMGTGRLFTQLEGVQTALVEKNIRGISITIPGYGWSSAQPSRSLGEWAKVDVRAVLEQEGILQGDAKIMVEGTSYGSAHAMAIASHFGDRVSAMHLVVPYINYELREELNMKLLSGDESFTCDSKTWPRSMFNCSPCTFCCCSCMMQCIACCPGCFADKGTKQLQEHVPGAVEAVNADIRRSWIQGVYGLIHNSFVDVISKNWGFDVKKIPTKKVIVSYAIDDKNSPTEQGKWLAEELFVGKDGMAKCKVNVGEGFHHSSHSVRLFNGEFVRELYEFSTQ